MPSAERNETQNKRTKLDREETVIALGCSCGLFYPQNERSHQYARKQYQRIAFC